MGGGCMHPGDNKQRKRFGGAYTDLREHFASNLFSWPHIWLGVFQQPVTVRNHSSWEGLRPENHKPKPLQLGGASAGEPQEPLQLGGGFGRVEQSPSFSHGAVSIRRRYLAFPVPGQPHLQACNVRRLPARATCPCGTSICRSSRCHWSRRSQRSLSSHHTSSKRCEYKRQICSGAVHRCQWDRSLDQLLQGWPRVDVLSAWCAGCRCPVPDLIGEYSRGNKRRSLCNSCLISTLNYSRSCSVAWEVGGGLARDCFPSPGRSEGEGVDSRRPS